jgi:hypothetical protein
MAQKDTTANTNMKIKTKTFRFEFTTEIMELIKRFAIIHQYDERKIYKEQWTNWFETQKEILEREITRMIEAGYEGDVQDKMFKAGRYYFRKRNIKEEKQTKKPHQHEAAAVAADTITRTYITMEPIILKSMDQHIINAFKDQKELKPEICYNHYCKNNEDLLRKEILRMLNENDMEGKELSEKIKKTYKNRYYMFTRN